MNEQTTVLTESEKSRDISKELHFEVSPAENVNPNNGYKKLDCNTEQTMSMSLLVQQLPALCAADALQDAYKVTFPEGVSGTLMRLRQGGYGSPIQNEEGTIVGHASFTPMSAEAVLLGAFSAMSIATGQYFLTEINNEMQMINQKIDTIIGFLYGDKKAELLSEISFAQYAYKNYSVIMQHREQRIATISELQSTRKTAMKDIEFYLSDLSGKVHTAAKGFGEFNTLSEEALQIKDSLELSMQLYVMSCIMEVYYSRNFDKSYLDYLKETAAFYINKCEKRILSDFSQLSAKVDSFKDLPMKKINTQPLKEKFGKVITSLNKGEESPMLQNLGTVLSFADRNNEYYLNRKGEVYIKCE